MVIEIKNVNAPELDVYLRLTEARTRNEQELFIAESVNVISAALDAGCEPVSMLAERRHIEGKAKELVNRLQSVPVYTAADEVITSITGYELHRGVLCALKRPKSVSVDELIANASTLCVLEGLTDTTNLGAIFRSAAAFDIGGVLLCGCCDPLSRRSLRVSTGNIFKIPWAVADENWLHTLKTAGFSVMALALTDRSVSVTDQSLLFCPKRALVFGNEGKGLKPETIENCDYTVKIPMKPGVDSLNVSAAAAVAFWTLK